MHIGDIVKLNNIIFNIDYKNGKMINKKSIDHAFDSGRPCIYIGEHNENMYFISLSNSSINSKHFLEPNKTNGLTKVCQANVKEIIKRPIAFYESIGYLTDKDMFEIYKTLKSFHKKRDFENRKAVMYLSNKYIRAYENGLVKYVDDEGIIIKKK